MTKDDNLLGLMNFLTYTSRSKLVHLNLMDSNKCFVYFVVSALLLLLIPFRTSELRAVDQARVSDIPEVDQEEAKILWIQKLGKY